MKQSIRFLAKMLIRTKILNKVTLGITQAFYHFFFRAPSALQIHTTNSCNLSCPYCYSLKNNEGLIDWHNVLQEAYQMGIRHVDFLGGEPLLDQNLQEYISFCTNHKINVAVHTNGTLLNDSWISFFQKHKKLTLSIKYDLEEELDQTFGSGYSQNLHHKIDTCLQNGITVQIHSFIHVRNYQNISKLIRFAREKNIFLTIERYMEQGRKDIDDNYAINTEQWNTALKVHHAYCESLDKNAVHAGMLKGNGCACYIDLLSINYNGLVLPCPFANQEQSVGDIRQEPLVQIWKRYQKLSRNVWMQIPKECARCRFKHFCHGGCKTHTYMKNRRYDVSDPLCQKGQLPLSIYLPPRK